MGKSKYTFRRKLGSGAYGTVYHGSDDLRQVAIKVFHGEDSKANFLAIKNEIKTLRRLRDRHIIQFYEAECHKNELRLVTDLAEGGSLKMAIKKGIINDWSTKERIAREICLGLSYIHAQNVLHRDLKSDNVLLTRLLEVKLCDFGCATVKTTSVANPSETHKGTVRWMAPELFAPVPEYTTKSDMYSVGMVMWEMAANCTTPFKEHLDSFAVVTLVKNGLRETLPADTPDHYRVWVERCWNHDPSLRPDARDFVADREAEADMVSSLEIEDTQSSVSFGFSTHTFSEPNREGFDDGLARSSSDGSRSGVAPDSPIVRNGLAPSGLTSSAAHLAIKQGDHAVGGNVDQLLSLAALYETGGDGHEKSESMAFELYLQAAKLGHSHAQNRVGDMYANGRGVERSDHEALRWYMASAQASHADSELQLGIMFLNGRAVQKNTMMAFTWLRGSAQKGNVEALGLLGMMYLDGDVPDHGVAEVVSWILKAAEGDDAVIQRIIGCMHKDSLGVEKSDEEAFKWFMKAAVQGDAIAQFNVASMYNDGRGVEQNDDEAARWYIAGAERGNPAAQVRVGMMFKIGKNVQQSDVEAFKWFRQAAIQGDACGQFNLGRMYDDGRGVEQSDSEAASWFLKAAEQGFVAAQSAVGVMFLHGRGIKQNDNEADKWLTMAANQGDADAQFRLGVWYEFGEEAIEWFTMAANQGDQDAQFNLGILYSGGAGGEVMMPEAIKWFTMAASHDDADTDALLCLGLDAEGIEAVEWFTKGANLGCTAASTNLGHMYRYGRHGVAQNYAEAAKWYTMAANLGDSGAQYSLGSMYKEGLGVEQSDDEAAKWLDMAGTWGVREVAAKRFFCSSDEASQEPIKNEIDMIRRLSYRYIIQFYGTCEIDSDLVIVTDLAEGGSLKRAIDSNVIPAKAWSMNARIVQEIAMGLAYIHWEGILHLDLKSDNVLLSKYLEVKLCDFGLAQVKTTSATRSTNSLDSAKGTFRWMAPEVMAKRPEYSTKSDVYSLGMVMWELASHCTVPFKEHREHAMIALLIQKGEREDLPDDTPEEYRRWVERCWDQIPKNRPEASEVKLTWDEKMEKPGQSSHEHPLVQAALSLPSLGAPKCVDPKCVEPTIEGGNSQGYESSVGYSAQTIHNSVDGADDNIDVNNESSVFTHVADSQPCQPHEHRQPAPELDVCERQFVYHLRAAMQGDHNAECRMGEIYLHAKGAIQSDAEAFRWFQKSANGGVALAQFNLGNMYRKGRGVEQNDIEAIQWYYKAAAQGNANGQAGLGWMYQHGQGVEQDDAEAARWYRKASEQGQLDAKFHLGWMYMNGQGVDQSDRRAVECFRKMAALGDARGESALGWVYFFGDGVEESDQEAIAWCRKGAAQGNKLAMYQLALMHELGIGLEQNDCEALVLYHKAADRGRNQELSHIPWLNRPSRRQYVSKSESEILAMYLEGAEEGIAAAQFGLGVLYEKGRGVPVDKTQAYGWYTKAACHGHRRAAERAEFLSSY
ncbi:hypothetical protein BGZ73_004222 [Actinomortierella ambigua]|nr:hypothetical protein BGZ73_004222 [Actinomortierella ambigua]